MSKAPNRRIDCGGYAVQRGGEVYHPHEGEFVEFNGGPSWSFMRDAATITRMESTPYNLLADDDSRELVMALGRVTEFLASRITAWNWTGQDGKRLPAPTRDVLERLEQSEVLWLISALISGDSPERAAESEKNV